MRKSLLLVILLIQATLLHAQPPDDLNNHIRSYHLDEFLIQVRKPYGDILRVFTIKTDKGFVVKDYYKNGALRGEAKDNNGRIHGLYVGYYKDGKVRDSGNYHKDLKWGTWRQYHKNGKLFRDLAFKDDLLHGILTEYDTLGNLIAKIESKKGKIINNSVTYYPGTEKIKSIMPYSNGLEEGEFKIYYIDGRLKRSETYKEGKYVEGSGKLFNDEGIEVPFKPVWTNLTFHGDMTKYMLSHMHYPIKSMEDNIEGTVYVKAIVDVKGRVKETEITTGINDECNAEALKIVNSLQFDPAVYDDENLEVTRRIYVPFNIKAFLKQQYINKEKEEQETMQEIEENSNPFR